MANPLSTGVSHLQLTSVKLNGSNYPNWSMATEVYVLATDQSFYLCEDKPKSDNADTHAKWVKGDAILQTLSFNSMDPAISPHFLRCRPT